MNKRKILVAMSGGVDSSVAAALLKEAGHEVGGATMRTWASGTCANLNTRACCGITGVEDARDVAASLDIPYWVLNFEDEFKTHVVDYFASEYVKGRTPNPCIACNEHIKFRLFLERARKMGFDAIATGHYAGLETDAATGRLVITEGIDSTKDQSYVLFPLPPALLNDLFLPLGGFTKKEIRQKAGQLNLSVTNKPDSQEICFIPSNDYREFMTKEFPDEAAGTGNIITSTGEVLGQHEGYFHYTRGQRRGLGVAHSERLYVLETRPETNEVVVGTKKNVFGLRCRVGRMNWFLPPGTVLEGTGLKETADLSPPEPPPLHVKIRSQHQKAPASITVLNDKEIDVQFDDPQDAITPGQGAVIYDGSRILAGGWIDSVG